MAEADKTDAPNQAEKGAPRKERINRPFPSSAFEEAERFAQEIYNFGSGSPVRRLSLFHHLDRSPDSSASRDALTNCSKYGLSKGSYKADIIELTNEAVRIFNEQTAPRDKAKLRVALAIQQIAPFVALYEKFVDLKLPARAALVDAARENLVPDIFIGEAVDTFVINLKSTGLLQNLAGAERVVTVEQLLSTIPDKRDQAQRTIDHSAPHSQGNLPITSAQAEFESMCFYVTPIGEDGTEYRQHSNLFLSYIVEPALEEFKLTVVRADQISAPGIISRQIFEHIMRARVVIADLSFHNPNVFYELAVRHMLRKPVVQICRSGDHIPFDINQMRTIMIDNSSIYTLIPQLDVYRSQISTQVRRALEGVESDNPISVYYPDLTVRASPQES